MTRGRTHARELGLVLVKLLAVAMSVAAMVFGLIVVLYDHAGPSASPAASASTR